MCKSQTLDLAPAIAHVDNTARLQTINPDQCETTYNIVDGHAATYGIPIVCNTSANFNGRGFFPDIASAEQWADAQDLLDRPRIALWNGETLFTR